MSSARSRTFRSARKKRGGPQAKEDEAMTRGVEWTGGDERRHGAAGMWNPEGPEPETMWEVIHRQIQYSSRVGTPIGRQLQTLAAPGDQGASRLQRGSGARQREHARTGRLGLPHALASWRLVAPPCIRTRWKAGYAAARKAIAEAPWTGDFDPLDGV